MKHMKKITLTLLTAMVLVAVLMTGCTKLPEVKNNTPSTTDAPAETGEYGVYIRLARDDVSSVYIHGGSISKDYENADGSALNAGEWVFTGEEIAELSKKDNCSVLFTVGAVTADGTLLGDAPDAPADVPPVLTLSILDEIDADVTVGTSGSSLTAVQAAVKLIEWGTATGLDANEISDAATTWLAAKNDDLEEFLQKLELVDDAYQKLLTDGARELLDSAGCADAQITWGSQPVEAVEAVMQATGLR